MSNIEPTYYPGQQRSGRRSSQEVLDDLMKQEGFCGKGHCVLGQFLSLNGQPRPGEYCNGEKANDGCPVKLAALEYGMTSWDFVFGRFLANMKFELGKNLGIEVNSAMARGIFERAGLETIFRAKFDEYMARGIKMDDVYNGVVNGRDLVGVAKDYFGEPGVQAERERTVVPSSGMRASSFFG